MAQVFVSYSTQHRDLTRDLVVRLVAEGYSVWWDRELEAWGEYEPQINEALLTAEVVVVIWSPGAVASRFVKAEVERALLARKLVNLRAPDFPLGDVPLNYSAVDHILTLDLDDLGPVMKTIDTVRRGEALFGARQLHEHYRERFGESLFDPRRQALPSDPAMVTPSVLLQAPFEVATFADAAGVLADMLDWCHGTGSHAETGRAVAGRLLHGPGGLGKTRLMIEAVRRLRAEGWLSGFYPAPPAGDPARSDLRRLAIQQVISHGPEAGVLMVLDYAESRAADVIELARMARKRPDDAVRPFRLVLLSRSEGWWQDIYRTEPEVQVVFNKRGALHGDVQVAQPLPEGPERLKVFDAMRATLAPIVTAQAAAGHFPPVREAALPQDRRERLASSPAYARPLALQMEALLSLAGEGGGEIAELLESVLLLERKHWRKVIAGLADDARREMAMRRGISQVTALGGVDARLALQRLMQRDPYFGQRAPVDMPLAELNRLYGRGEAWVAPLEPDLIGEHELLVSGDEDLLDACRAWIDGLPEPDRSPRRRILFTVLQRAARAEHGARAGEARDWLRNVIASLSLSEVPDLIAITRESGGAMISLLVQAAPLMEQSLVEGVMQAVLPLRLLSVLPIKEKFSEELLQRSRSVYSSNRSDHSILKLRTSLRYRAMVLSVIARYDEALTNIEEAINMPLDSSELGQEALIEECRILSCYSGILFSTKRHGLAIERGDEALKLLDGVQLISEEQEMVLAALLSNQAHQLSNFYRQGEAIGVAERGVQLLRRLYRSGRLEAGPMLADCLIKLSESIFFSSNSDARKALAACDEAIELLRRLRLDRPEEYTGTIIDVLMFKSTLMSQLGKLEEAIAAAGEAIDLSRKLYVARVDLFSQTLIANLAGYGILLSRAGREEEYRATKQEIAEIRSKMA